MNFSERALDFCCGSERLVAVMSVPDRPVPRGVLVVVGGPQYRAGSHRQFTLLCRALAGQGIATMRFDYRGMGDSQGEMRTFEDVGQDIRAAIDEFFIQLPEMREVVIWGLCDAASAALFYAHLDPRVSGVVLLNPWVRTSSGIAMTHLKHYYWSRITEPELWRKLARGQFDFATAARSFAGTITAAFGFKRGGEIKNDLSDISAQPAPRPDIPLPQRMADGFGRFKGRVLLILSGKDLTAQEFGEAVRASSRWRKLLADPRVLRRDLQQADHTFSRRVWRDQVAIWTADWVRSW